jgi:hypothetical protein
LKYFIYLQIQINEMVKNYASILVLLFFLIAYTSNAQDSKQQSKPQETTIEGLNFYPNPVSNGKIYITSKLALTKEVMVYDVLGKVVLQANISSKEMNVSSLSPGVYMIKIKEGEATATRKLIVK